MTAFDRKKLTLLRKVAQGEELGRVLQFVVDLVEEQQEDLFCTLFLLDHHRQVLYGGVSRRVPRAYLEAVHGEPIGPHAGSCGAAAFLGETIVVEDIATHPNWVPYREAAEQFGFKACWSSPILSQGSDVLGTFAIFYPDRRPPTPEEREWVEGATDIAAIAIERQRGNVALEASERKARRQARLYSVASRVNALVARRESAESLYDAFCRIPVDEGLAVMAWLGRYHQEDDRFEVLCCAGDGGDYLSTIRLSLTDPQIARGPAGRALHSNLPALTSDVLQDEGFYWKDEARRHGYRSCLALPLKLSRGERGLLVIYGAEPEDLGEEEIEVLASATDNLSFVLDVLEKESQRLATARRLQVLQALSDLAGEETSVDQLMQRVVELLGRHLGASRCNYGLVEEDDRLHVPFDYTDGCESVTGHLRISDFGPGIVERMSGSDPSLVVCDAEKELPGHLGADPMRRVSVRAFICARLVRGGKLRAILSVHQSEPREWTPHEIALAQEVAERCWSMIEQRGAEERLQTRERLFQIAGRVARIGGWTITLPNLHTEWSDQALEILGPKASLAATFAECAGLFHPQYRQQVLDAVHSCMIEGKTFDLEAELLSEGPQEVRVRLVGQAEFDRDHKVISVQGALQDVTQRHTLETQLRQTQKLEAIGQLAGGIAHDFNNLMTVVLSYAEFALESLPEDDELYDDLQQIQRAGERASDLTRQLLAFSRRQVLRPKVTCLNSILKGLRSMMHRLVGERIRINWLLDPNSGRIHADENQLEQVVMNLIVNARDAMPHGGVIKVQTSNQRASDGGCGRVRLELTDQGEGMSEEVRARIFEPFYTTKAPGKGTGLGLSTVWGIITQSGGEISVQSTPGQGTTFFVDFPTTSAPLLESSPMPKPGENLQGQATILLVEDEHQVREAVSTALQSRGYQVLEAQNAGEAVLISERTEEMIDLLVTDMIMPVMGGAELAQRLTRERPDMATLFISGYTESEPQLSDPGVASDFLPKPIRPAVLLRKVKELLARRESAASRIS